MALFLVFFLVMMLGNNCNIWDLTRRSCASVLWTYF